MTEHAAQKTGYRNLAFVPSFLTDGGTNKEGDAATTGGKSVRGIPSNRTDRSCVLWL